MKPLIAVWAICLAAILFNSCMSLTPQQQEEVKQVELESDAINLVTAEETK